MEHVLHGSSAKTHRNRFCRPLATLAAKNCFGTNDAGHCGVYLWIYFLDSSAVYDQLALLPSFNFAGFDQYAKLMDNDRWLTSITNLGVFGLLFMLVAIVLGVGLAILLDQNIRQEGAIRTIYLYPMALSFIVTGTAWKWILNPASGLKN